MNVILHKCFLKSRTLHGKIKMEVDESWEVRVWMRIYLSCPGKIKAKFAWKAWSRVEFFFKYMFRSNKDKSCMRVDEGPRIIERSNKSES